MFKKQRKMIVVLVALILTLSLTACTSESSSDTPAPSGSFTAVSGFYYSGDKGHTYGDGTKEYEIGESVYMKVKFKVLSNKKKTSQVKVVLTIPNVKNVDAKYMDGQVITPNFDAVNNVTTYEFTANASKEATESECVVQFVPNAVGSVTMTLVYDDNVDPSYDIQSTLEFVDSKKDTSEE